MKMACNKVTVTGAIVIVLVLATIFTFLFWPKGETMDVDLDVKDIGDRNNIKTTETKEISFLHIEGLASAQRTSNWMTMIGFAILFSAIGFAAFHFKYVKGPRRIRKDMEREQTLDRLHEMEEVLVDLGYMKKKRTRKGKRGKKTVSKKMKKKPTRTVDIEEDEDEEDNEDE